MAFDRDTTLKKGEKLLRQGRLDAAIAEYARVVDDQPSDWNTLNLLGDLYVRAGQTDKALAQYSQVADHFMREGFYPKAVALYKKILKLKPDDETCQLQLANLSATQGLLADARNYLNAILGRRRARGDHQGASEIIVRLGSIDPSDIEARLAAARVLEERGDVDLAVARFRALHADLAEKGRSAEALDALRHIVRLQPGDRDARTALARASVEAGNHEATREYLDSESAAGHPVLELALVEMKLRQGDAEGARTLLERLMSATPDVRARALELAWTLSSDQPDAAFVCVDVAADNAVAASEFNAAAAALREFATRVPGYIPALMKLIEVTVDGGLESAMQAAQAQLADAYLDAGHGTEARAISEDLIAREPWERAHIDRFRRALVMLRVDGPDVVIASRFGGEVPFVATDHFGPAIAADAGRAPEPAAPRQEETHSTPAPAADPPHGEKAASSKPTESTQARSVDDGDDGDDADGAEVDLTSALGALAATETAPAAAKALDETFRGLREKADSRHRDFSAQYMKLARTYLEMGLVDQAIASLQTAEASPPHRFEAAATLGRLYAQRADTVHAIHWLERASKAPAPTPEEGKKVLYDLGVLLDAAGQTARSLAVFIELQSQAPDYRDVAERVDRLARVQTGG